jgi:outer membrane protein assembly factor BamB
LVFTFEGYAGYGGLIALRAATGERVWSTQWVGGESGVMKISGDTVYYAGGRVYAHDVATGAEKWVTEFGASECDSGVAIAAGRLYCLTPDQLVALDETTGATVFAAPAAAPSAVSAPSVAYGLVYYVGAKLYAHSALDGALVWEADFGVRPADADGNQLYVPTSPAVAKGRVYVAYGWEETQVYAFDALDGRRLWTAPVRRYATNLAVADGRVIAGGVEMLDEETGAVLWQAPGAELAASTPAVTDAHFFGGALLVPAQVTPDTVVKSRIFAWSGLVPGDPPAY